MRLLGYLSFLLFMPLVISCGKNALRDREEAHLASACGTVLGTFDGVNAYSNGANTGTGNSCGGRSSYGLNYQCVELVSRYFVTKYNSPVFGCNAQDCMGYMGSDQFYKMYNGSVADVQPGDAIVFDSGVYGHIALVSNVSGNSVTFLNQNTASAYGTVSFNGGTLSGWGSMTVKGIMRHVNATPGGGTTGGPADTTWRDFTEKFRFIGTDKLKCSNLYITNLSGDKSVRVRQAPSKSAPVVTSLADGTTITISGAIAGSDETKIVDPDLANKGIKGSKGEPGVEYIWLKLSSPVEGWLNKFYANCL